MKTLDFLETAAEMKQ